LVAKQQESRKAKQSQDEAARKANAAAKLQELEAKIKKKKTDEAGLAKKKADERREKIKPQQQWRSPSKSKAMERQTIVEEQRKSRAADKLKEMDARIKAKESGPDTSGAQPAGDRELVPSERHGKYYEHDSREGGSGGSGTNLQGESPPSAVTAAPVPVRDRPAPTEEELKKQHEKEQLRVKLQAERAERAKKKVKEVEEERKVRAAEKLREFEERLG
jgi:hypothetical protein